MKHIVALSGGKDSTAMAMALKEREPKPYIYVCTPTGDELPNMVAHINRFEELLDAPIWKLTNGTLASQIEANHMLPNSRARWCTRLLKLKPFGEFIQRNAPCVAYVGLRADEDDREGTKPGGDGAPIGTDVVQDFPFQRWGWGLEEVLGYLESKGIVVPERTDCARCPYQRLGEWYNLWKNYPDIYSSAELDESKWGHTFRSPSRDSWPAKLSEMRQRFELGVIPDKSLNRMLRDKQCRACTL